MKTAMIRENQELVDAAYRHLSSASQNVVMGITCAIGKNNSGKYLEHYGLEIDESIAEAHKGLSFLYQLQYIRDKDATVDLSERTNGVVPTDTKMLASDESPVIQSLPVTDKIQPVNRVPFALPKMVRVF